MWISLFEHLFVCLYLFTGEEFVCLIVVVHTSVHIFVWLYVLYLSTFFVWIPREDLFSLVVFVCKWYFFCLIEWFTRWIFLSDKILFYLSNFFVWWYLLTSVGHFCLIELSVDLFFFVRCICLHNMICFVLCLCFTR